MSTREFAYSMIDNLNQEQLDALIVILRGLVKKEQPSEKELAVKRTAFEELKKLCRPIPDLDEKKNLKNTEMRNMAYKNSD